MIRGLLRAFFGLLIALFICGVPGRAQTITGAVTGTVADPSGSVVPGAHVAAQNVETGVTSEATTDRAGLYRIAFLPIGRYQLTVTASGFGTETVPPFQLEALQTDTFNVTLKVGGGSETVNVSEAAPILNTENSTLSSTFTANTIQNFPLNGLDFSALTLYVPGAVSTAGTGGTTSIERSTYYTDSVNLNGNRAQANNYTLDGIDINETFNNLISYSPAPESLQEIKVLTANSPADYGNVEWRGRGRSLEERHQLLSRLGLRISAGLPLQRELVLEQAAVPCYSDKPVLAGPVRRKPGWADQTRQAVLLRRLSWFPLSPGGNQVDKRLYASDAER